MFDWEIADRAETGEWLTGRQGEDRGLRMEDRGWTRGGMLLDEPLLGSYSKSSILDLSSAIIILQTLFSCC